MVKLSLRRKIVGGFGVLLLLIIALGWVTLSLVNSLSNVQTRVFNDAIPGLVAGDEIVRSYTAQSAAVSAYLIDGKPTLLDQYRSEVATANMWEDRAADLFTSPEEQGLLSELVEIGHSFQRLMEREVIPLAARGNRSQAFRVLGDEGSPLIDRIQVVGGLLRQAQDAVVVQTEADLTTHSRQTIAILLVVVAGSILLGIILTTVLPRRLSKNIAALVEAARSIGRGDLNQELDIHSHDEIQELAERFIEMQAGLKRLQQLALQDRELQIAATIQRNLLQRTLPETPGARIVPLHHQANLVGGDWYDVDVSGRELTVVVGDASGKGIAAALMATVALTALRAERGLGAGPQQLIDRANEALREATDTDSFTTLVYATFNLDSGEMRWLNMGHPSPFMLSGEPDHPRGYFLEGPRNRALGWFEHPGLAQTIIELSPGDRLFIYTDGFIEAKSSSGEVFGENRFAKAILRSASLEGEDFIREVVREVELWSAGKLQDDLTMIVLEYQGAPVEVAVSAEKTGRQ